MQVTTSVQLERIEQFPDGSITAYFSDNPAAGMSFTSQADMDAFLGNTNQWLPALKAMLLLDWTQEQVLGKTANLSCADPNDHWVVAN